MSRYKERRISRLDLLLLTIYGDRMILDIIGDLFDDPFTSLAVSGKRTGRRIDVTDLDLVTGLRFGI